MQTPMMDLPRGFRMTLAGVAALISMAFATPALAADEEYRGWFAALDFASTQPESLDQHFANHVDKAATPINDERLVIDNKTGNTYRAAVGYGFGKGLGSLRVSYWTFDHDDKMTGTVAGYLSPTLFGFGYNYVYLYNAAGVDFTATSKVKAHAADLDYVRTLVTGEKSSLSWLAGLRVASYEEDQGFEGLDGIHDYAQAKHLKSNGVGPRVGAIANFGFTKHFSLESSVVMSFLQSDTKGDASLDIISSATRQTREAKDDHIRGQIMDFDARAVWSYGPVDYYLGYSMSSWSGMVTDPVPANGGPFFSIGPTADRGRDNISFNSIEGGIIVRFRNRGFSP